MKYYETPNVWHQCLEAGAIAMRRPYALRQFRRPGFPRITLFHIPSFADATGWTIYSNPREGGYGLQTVTWHQRADRERMQRLMTGESAAESAEPTLRETFEAIDPGWVESQIAELSKIVVPLHAKHSVGMDGESFGIRMRGKFQVEWWCEGPEEWRELVAWAHGCLDHFREAKVERAAASNGADARDFHSTGSEG